MKIKILLFVLLIIVISNTGYTKSPRVGLFVGANKGNFTEENLFYAPEDALKMYMAFSNFGNLHKNLAFLVQNESVSYVKSKITELKERISLLKSQNNQPVECVFYYSGHGGTDGLHIDNNLYSYTDLYGDLKSLGCNMMIIMLDACNSGRMLSVKGVKYSADKFRVKMYDSKSGEIFITSSADTEYSQELDEYKGSVFTHFLVNGLLGSADENKDKRITLTEAYTFASEKTIHKTFGSAKGFQVPKYKYNVKGSQNIVLTELNVDTEIIVLPAVLPNVDSGSLTFMVKDKGVVFGDFKFTKGYCRLSIPKGKYLVRLRSKNDNTYLANLDIKGSMQTNWSRFKKIKKSYDPFKGSRVFRYYTIEASGGIRLSSESLNGNSRYYGGNFSLYFDNIFIPPVFLGLSFKSFKAESSTSLFEMPVRNISSIYGAGIILGIKKRFNQYLKLSGFLNISSEYISLKKEYHNFKEQNSGYIFNPSLDLNAVLIISKDIGIIIPKISLSTANYKKDGSIKSFFTAGLYSGIELTF